MRLIANKILINKTQELRIMTLLIYNMGRNVKCQPTSS